MTLDLTTPPPRLTRRELGIAGAVAIAVAITRVVALARTPWDWDEMLFLLGLRDYDVSLHHPHPPGFPLFILSARLFVAAGFEPFHALQAVNVIAAVFIVPALLFLCRELRLPFETSLGAAMLFAFFPNVWFFGGTAFSDVPAIVIAIAACALLLRGSRSPSAFIAGALVLAVAAGFRPQNLLVGALPAIAGAWNLIRRRRVGAVLAAVAIGAAITIASYGGAVMATGTWWQYRDAVLAHQRYLRDVDSFLSDVRPSLLQVSDDFFVRPFRFPPINVVLSLLALISTAAAVLRRRVSILLALGIFGPFWILAWLTLDFHSAGRFSIGYMPLLAILSADGLALVFARWLRSERSRQLATFASAGAIAAVMAAWTWNGILRARTEMSPPMQAIAFIRQSAPRDSVIYVPKRLRPYAEYYLGDFRLVHLEGERPGVARRGGVLLVEGGSTAPGARTFEWPEHPLWNIARRRYFAVSVIPRA